MDLFCCAIVGRKIFVDFYEIFHFLLYNKNAKYVMLSIDKKICNQKYQKKNDFSAIQKNKPKIIYIDVC